MKISFFGAVREVTGSNILIEAENKKFLVDCGVFQGEKMIENRNYEPFPYEPAAIQFVLLTHAHLDHCGRLPKLYHEGFRGKIYTTPATRDLTIMSLNDSAELILEEAEEHGHEPYFTKEDVDRLVGLFEPINYGEIKEILPGIKIRPQEAGHILGSSSFEVWADGEKAVFSGDLGNQPVPILRPPAKIEAADYVIMEATYGSEFHKELANRRQFLKEAVDYIVEHKGILMIPSFAIQRTQEIMYELDFLAEHNEIPRNIPIFVDSPLAIEATEIFSKYPDYFNPEAQRILKSGEDFLHFENLKFTESVEESKHINFVDPPKIIIAGSGMLTAGRITHHLRRYISDDRNYLLLVGFQVNGTLGRRLLDGAQYIRIFGEEHTVRAKVKLANAFSAHADQKQLIDWLSCIQGVKKVYLNHGEEDRLIALGEAIKNTLNLEVDIPEKLIPANSPV
jgi:metallo-beta-lactamase family protein